MKPICTLLLLALCRVAFAQLVASPDVFDFGLVREHERPVGTITLTNKGAQPVSVTRIMRTCACSEATIDSPRIAPGESANVLFWLDPNDLAHGPFYKSFYVRTDHPEQPVVMLAMRGEVAAGCAEGILNAPDANYNPAVDDALPVRYDAATHVVGRRAAKRELQERLSLEVDDAAPILFWPSRLDPVQKGCQLLAEILYRTVAKYWDRKLQVVFVANGDYQRVFNDIVNFHDIHGRVAVASFDESLSRLAYAGSDFVLMPSRFEPCGLPQMVGVLYGSLPIVHDTGGLHDTVDHLDVAAGRGNGFVFKHYDDAALAWGIDEAMRFHALPAEDRAAQISRIMRESAARFTHQVCAKAYMEMYEHMLHRPLIV